MWSVAWFPAAVPRRGRAPPLYFTSEDLDGDLLNTDPAKAQDEFAALHAGVGNLVRRALVGASLDDTFHHGTTRRPLATGWIYLHMIEEYARHNGHADMLRERIGRRDRRTESGGRRGVRESGHSG